MSFNRPVSLQHPLTKGVFPALWTPTDRDGNLLEPELVELIRFCARSGVHGLMALGTTGEFPHLEIAQRKRVLEIAKENAGSLPILANVSDIRHRVVAELGKFARQIGVDAISLLPPYYYSLAQEDLVEFFVRSADAAQLPLFLYNFPERAGCKISLETIAAVADRSPLLGIKQSGSEFSYHKDLVALGREKNFVVITGSDTALPEALALGVQGTVSGLANAVPDLVVEVYHAARSGLSRADIPSSGRLKQIEELANTLEFPLNIAALIAARGFAVGEPKILISSASLARREKLTAEFRRLFKEWKLI